MYYNGNKVFISNNTNLYFKKDHKCEEDFIMKEKLMINITKPQYVQVSDITYAQVDSWYDHCRRDLKLDLIYPEDMSDKRYPCIVWICGGGWMRMDKSAHLSYLSTLAHQGFVVCSVEYRTSNEGCYPMQIEDVKAAIRYLKAHADRYRIDKEHFGAMGESAGGFLTCMAALDHDKVHDVGEYLEESSSIQAACPWYPPTNLSTFKYKDAEECAASMESLLLGYNTMRNIKEAYNSSPVSKVTKDAPPFLIIHGINDQTVPFEQSEELYDKLIENGCDADLIALEGADHADLQFFQDELWDRIIEFFKTKLG